MHVRVDHAGKASRPLAGEDFAGARRVDGRRHLGDLAAGDGDVRVVHGVAVRAHDAHALDQQVESQVGS